MVAVYRAKLYVLCSMTVLPFLFINLSCQALITYMWRFILLGGLEVFSKSRLVVISLDTLI